MAMLVQVPPFPTVSLSQMLPDCSLSTAFPDCFCAIWSGAIKENEMRYIIGTNGQASVPANAIVGQAPRQIICFVAVVQCGRFTIKWDHGEF